MMILRMICSVPRRLPKRLKASHPGKDICSGHWERGGRDMKENPGFDWCEGWAIGEKLYLVKFSTVLLLELKGELKSPGFQDLF